MTTLLHLESQVLVCHLVDPVDVLERLWECGFDVELDYALLLLKTIRTDAANLFTMLLIVLDVSMLSIDHGDAFKNKSTFLAYGRRGKSTQEMTRGVSVLCCRQNP